MAIIGLEMTVETPLRIGDGMSVRRDRVGRPCIPATALKGCLRESIGQIAHAFAWPTCRPPDSATMCHPVAASETSAAEPCVVCQLLGSPWTEGLLYLGDLVTDDPPVLATRQHAAWSRTRGVALNSLTVHGEALPAGTVFSGVLRHNLIERWQLGLLVAGLSAVRRIGEGYAVGWGACHITMSGLGNRSALADALEGYRLDRARGRG